MQDCTERSFFSPLFVCKKGNIYKFRKRGTLSYTKCSELIREKMRELDEHPDEYGTHSLMRGGTALNNDSDRLFKKHGRWKSDSAKDGYVSEDISSLLSITSKLGLLFL